MEKIEAESIQLSGLLSRDVFQVPFHQRRYEWEPKQILDYLEDLKSAMEESIEQYFLGTIMLIPHKNKGGVATG